MPGFLVLPSPHLNNLHVPLPAHTKHIQQHQRFLFHIYVGFPYLLVVNRRFIGDEARGQRFAQGELHSCGHLRSKCSNCPQHLYTRPCDSSTENCVFSRNYTRSFRSYTWGCPKRLLTYSKGPQNTPITAAPVAHLQYRPANTGLQNPIITS